MVIYLSTLFRKLYLRNFNCFSIYPPQATGCVFIKLYLFANKSSGEHQEPTTYKLFCLHIQQSIPSNRSFCKSSTYKDQSCLFITLSYRDQSCLFTNKSSTYRDADADQINLFISQSRASNICETLLWARLLLYMS